MQSTPPILPRDSDRESKQHATSYRGDWERHWTSLSGSESQAFFSLASRLVRRFIFQPAVRHFLEKYFPHAGDFLEAGCGTGESSVGVPRHQRRFVGLDFSGEALRLARTSACFDSLICGDLFQIPLRSDSICGIWNLGVMEHFEKQLLLRALSEFRRVLKPRAPVVLFWPAERNSSRWILAPVEAIRSFVVRRRFTFFPDEVSRLKSRQEARDLLSSAGFEVLEIDFSVRTAFIHMVVVARRT
jgi:SAM-dependent methyltransferase